MADGQEWSRRFPHEGGELPALYVVRADGELLYAKTGVPASIPFFLREQLRASGSILSTADLERTSTAVDAANRLLFDGDTAGAARSIARYAESGSYAQAAQRADRLAGQLTRRGQRSLAAAQKKLASSQDAFAGALLFAEVQRIYGKLPTMRKALFDAGQSYKDNPQVSLLLKQAELIDGAKQDAAEGKQAEAAELLQQVIKEFPETEAARLAQELRARLSAASETQSLDTAEEARRKAASYLRLAKTLKNEQKAREYAGKVLELVPADDPLAQQARSVLEQLKE